MNTHLKQLWAAMKLPKNFKKSYKFFCLGLDIRVLEEMKAYAANQYQLQRVTLSAMPAWTADYFTKRRFHPMEVTQPCSFVPMQAKTVARAIYEKKEIPSGVILGTSIGGLAVCAAVAVGFMVLWMHGIV